MKFSSKAIIFTVFLVGALVIGLVISFNIINSRDVFQNPLVEIIDKKKVELPLSKYKIEKMAEFPFVSSQIKIKNKIADFDGYSSYLFTYLASEGTISGQLNLPNNYHNSDKIIILLRGYVPVESYTTGVGTKSAAGVFAKNGYITLAPDFLGYGQSSPEVIDSWESRFLKPINVIELINDLSVFDPAKEECLYLKDLAKDEKEIIDDSSCIDSLNNSYKLGIWAHSNGGQIALSVLEGLNISIPTTLWAPVTAPFPYSILFFSDEYEDEGKATRKWLAQFEQKYDVFDFSISQHLDRLNGPIIIHHGTADEAALQSWSLEFMDKVEVENELREKYNQELSQLSVNATISAQTHEKELIDIKFYSYPGTDHNLRPSWNEAINRDLDFFARVLKD